MFLLDTSDVVHINSDQLVEENPHQIEMDSFRSQLVHERAIKCYTAHFQSWCQTFGKHENILVDDCPGRWLLGENQVGLVLTKPLFRHLNREIIFHGKTPTLVFDEQAVHIGQFVFPFKSKHEKRVLGAIEQFFQSGAALHLFRTTHALYGNGSRILTISSGRPRPVIYKEIGAMSIRLQ